MLIKDNMVVKEDIITDICYKTGYSRTVVEIVIDTLLDDITNSLSKGESVQFFGFGTFEPKECAPRVGRNPHTNEPVKIPARIVPKFRAGKQLKSSVVKEVVDENKLRELYLSHKSNCCKCGCELEDMSGTGLGGCFVLDRQGNFYCMNCDSEFEDGDERIFDLD